MASGQLRGFRTEPLDALQGRLARYRHPRSLDFTLKMPRDPSGKLYRRGLRDPYWAGRERVTEGHI